ncbi:DUF1653 domain-containing protein [Lentisphaera profundi]|uniref:DUF1653 domain-containing protein n=1 Tax=Lentisphaera profundi TaxID=1658616 RepID=A0ABY7VSV3_9BACT|nr:DUF1653 domain-containing protein [Lentisphaera profundi]WDE95921.1 DUF1653 domain-containing protein [Lentisphaera profundi]
MKKGIYRHYKGNFYQVIDVAKDSETEEDFVIYRPMYGERALWIRPLAMFSEIIERDGASVQRFSFHSEKK